jgi:hypothetical protein
MAVGVELLTRFWWWGWSGGEGVGGVVIKYMRRERLGHCQAG